MPHSFYEASALKWVNEVTKILDNNNVSMLELVVQTLRHGHNVRSMERHHRSLTSNVASVMSLLEEKAPEDTYDQALLIAQKIYRAEISTLIQRDQGLHFGARTATLGQMESFCIEDLGIAMRKSSPELWKLLSVLLDVNNERRRVYAANTTPDVNNSEDQHIEGDNEFEYSDSEDEGDCEGEVDSEGDAVMASDSRPRSDNAVDSATKPTRESKRRRTQDRVARDKALTLIKHVVIISILGQSSNERFNSLQCFVGYFLESKHTPEIVLELIAHMGLSVSNQSIRNLNNSLSTEARNRLRSLPNTLNSVHDNFDMDFNVAQPTIQNRKLHWSATAATFAHYRGVDWNRDLRFVKELRLTSPYNEDIKPEARTNLTPSFADVLPRIEKVGATIKDAMAWHLRSILVEHGGDLFSGFRELLGRPGVVDGLTYTEKDISFPASAIDANEGTYDGNWEVLENLYHQRNVPDSIHEEYLTFVHGDLATKERIDGLRRSRRIEATAKNRLDNILFIPGLFHVLLAAANAIWRLHILPMGDRGERLGLYEYINILRPKATGEFTSKNGPSYHSMHEVIHHALWADVLNIWRIEVQRKYRHTNLKSWANSKPTWNNIVQLSEEMVEQYVPNAMFARNRRRNTKERDLVFENLALRLQHSLLYIELCRAVKYGDVGRVLDLLSWWIPIFSASGKHKYAAHLTRFLFDLNRRYPPPLRAAVLRNWLFNSKGTPDGFRPFDWLQEYNNLYTKTIFAGHGPNRTKKLVMKRSVLLPIYKTVHRSIEENFHLTHRTVRHSKPVMTKTIQRLICMIEELEGHIIKPGRLSSTSGSQHKWEIKDAVTDGFGLLSASKDLFDLANEDTGVHDDEVENTGATEVTGDDVGVVY